MLGLVLLSLPFYWTSLDIPKRIVNDAIQGRAFKDGQQTANLFKFSLSLPDFLGGAQLVSFDGIGFQQISYLYALSGMFLFFVLVNGAFKYVINIRKGILGERMLRRLRFDLVALMLRFRPEDMRNIKPSEAASMIKDEVEPIGGFIGDAFIEPAFLGTQAITALMFIMMQNVWLGLMAVTIVFLQAVFVPVLRREQIRLGRIRQLKSRELAGRIGEIVEISPFIRVHGTGKYQAADIGDRLWTLFEIRAALFKRKFGVKYLNNLLAQLAPFFFYTVGGYLALNGRIDIGQLVAVIGAYRDLPPPIKDLIDWDQARTEAIIKYEQVVLQFSRPTTADEVAGTEPVLPPADAPIVLGSLKVMEGRGTVLLDTLSLDLQRPGLVALVGPSGSGRDILPKVIGRQITSYQGVARLGDYSFASMPDRVASRVIAYAGSDHHLVSGTIRDNICASLNRTMPAQGTDADDSRERLRRKEARNTGNPEVSAMADWIDYAAAGVGGAEELDQAVLDALRVAAADDDIYRLGLRGRFGDTPDAGLAEGFVKARHAIRARLAEKGLTNLIEPFDPQRYNNSASIRENLLFGVALDERLARENLTADAFFRSIIQAEGLLEPLTDAGLKIVETVTEVFAGLPSDHPLFERFSLIQPLDMPSYARLLEYAADRESRLRLPMEGRIKLVSLALSYVEQRHRLSILDLPFCARILRARASFRRFLPAAYAESIEFYDPEKVMVSAPVQDNLLFGRIAFGIAKAEARVTAVVDETLAELDLRKLIFRLGLDFEVGVNGRQLQAPQRIAINLARCLVRRPDILVLDGTLAGLGSVESREIMRRVRENMTGRTLIATFSDVGDTEGFDRVLTFEGARLVSNKAAAAETHGAEADDPAARSANAQPKTEQTEQKAAAPRMAGVT